MCIVKWIYWYTWYTNIRDILIYMTYWYTWHIDKHDTLGRAPHPRCVHFCAPALAIYFLCLSTYLYIYIYAYQYISIPICMCINLYVYQSICILIYTRVRYTHYNTHKRHYNTHKSITVVSLISLDNTFCIWISHFVFAHRAA